MPAETIPQLTRRNFFKISALWATAAWLASADSHLEAKVESRAGKGEYDLIVVGAGLGGLTCAGYAAGKGLKVLVVERHDIPGGYASAFTRGDPELTFDVSLHQIVLHGAAKKIFDEMGVMEKVKFHKCDQLFRYYSKEMDISCPAPGPEAFKEAFMKEFPEERKAIKGFTDDMTRIHMEVESLMSKGKPSLLDKVTFPLRYPALWASRKKTLSDYLDEHTSNPKLRAALSVFWSYYGLPPSSLSGFYYMNATGAYVLYGGAYPEGSSQAISDAMAHNIRSKGGELRFGTTVDKALVQDGRVHGILTEEGETIRSRAVVFNGSADRLFNKMINKDDTPDNYLKRIESHKPSISSFLVWLGLDKDITGSMRDSHIFLRFEDDPEKAYDAAMRADPDRASIGVCVYNNMSKDYSPPGTTVLSIVFACGYEPFKIYEKDYRAGNKQEYNKRKEEITQAVIARVEKALIPDLSKMIKVKEAATPLTNIRYTLNTHGAIYGYEQTLDNSFMNRISNRTPIKGLYLASAWGEPGGGYPAVLISGKKTFGMLMDDWEEL
jgi:prolycopene isomerase